MRRIPVKYELNLSTERRGETAIDFVIIASVCTLIATSVLLGRRRRNRRASPTRRRSERWRSYGGPG